VFKIEAENSSLLFTGDIEEEAEHDLLYLDEWLKSDIIKVPHHGGKTSSSVEFINAVNPQIAVVSAGKNNPFHHPHKKTLERYKKAGAELFRTDMDGAITITSVDDSFQISTWQDGRIKKVYSMFDEVRNLRLLFSY
jgi:competence protein ComEC